VGVAVKVTFVPVQIFVPGKAEIFAEGVTKGTAVTVTAPDVDGLQAPEVTTLLK
jgi:hypothetical protein